jgi:Spy/CpxP family protein refolding chaperone
VPIPRPTALYPGPGYQALKDFLGLTDAQIKQLTDLQRSIQIANQATYQQIAIKQKQLNDMLNSGSADAAAVGKLEIEMAGLRKQAGAPKPTRDQALAILNDAQRAKLVELQNAFKLQQAAGQALGLGLIETPAQPVIHAMGEPGLGN